MRFKTANYANWHDRKYVMIFIVLCVGLGFAIPQNIDAQDHQDHYEYQYAYELETSRAADPAQQERATRVEMTSPTRPQLGVFLENLDFETAYKRHYDYTYGVLVTNIIPGSPAARAGLMQDDIIMELDGNEIQYNAQVERLLAGKQGGDLISVRYFRDEQVRTTEVTLEATTTAPEPERVDVRRRPRFRIFSDDTGDGGFGFNASWFTPDHEEISNLITDMGFADVLSDAPVDGLSDDGFMMRGFQLQFEGDNGWYWGILRNAYKVERRRSVPATNTIRQLDYKLGYWGFNLDKRVRFLETFLLDGGIMLGWGSYDIKLLESINNPDWVNLNSQLESGLNNYTELKKRYLIAQPSAALYINLTDWVGLQGRLGYLYGYPLHSGWEAEVIGENFEVPNSPETELQGYTYSLGVWFDIF